MKIIAGTFKGRNLKVPAGIRPVSMLVKKACFDILGQEPVSGRILDLYAGSGALGLEAVSRGAREAVFIDCQRTCVAAIKNNITSLGGRFHFEVYSNDFAAALKILHTRQKQFELVFLDPPYYQGMLIKALQLLEEYDIVTPFGFVVCFCYSKDVFPREQGLLRLILDKKYGQTLLIIYRKEVSPQD